MHPCLYSDRGTANSPRTNTHSQGTRWRNRTAYTGRCGGVYTFIFKKLMANGKGQTKGVNIVSICAVIDGQSQSREVVVKIEWRGSWDQFSLSSC